jgi:mRNA-degrading endonuclease RelE of RelBE toxin-antitoxin system
MNPLCSISEMLENIDTIAENPQELTVTHDDVPVFSILPYPLYEALLETLDVVADHDAMNALRQNQGAPHQPLKMHTLIEKKTPLHDYTVVLSDAVRHILRSEDARQIKTKVLKQLKTLSNDPQAQGKRLIASLKGYYSLRPEGQHYWCLYTIEEEQRLVEITYLSLPKALSQQTYLRLLKGSAMAI